MGCAASTPVAAADVEKFANGNSKVDPEPIKIGDDINISTIKTKGLAFEVPINEDDNLIKKHPPKRLQRLEDQQLPSLTHRLLDEKQAEAEQRRQQILSQRIQSAKKHVKTKRSFMSPTESNGLLESLNHELSTVEL